jgi:hypothetical protein
MSAKNVIHLAEHALQSRTRHGWEALQAGAAYPVDAS